MRKQHAVMACLPPRTTNRRIKSSWICRGSRASNVQRALIRTPLKAMDGRARISQRVSSEQDREVAQARWYQLVGKLLHLKSGVANLRLPVQPWAQPTALWQAKKTECPHPEEHVVRGSNQWGTWRRCLACQTKIEYQPYSVENPRPLGKQSKHQVTYVPQPKALPTMSKAKSTKMEKSHSGISQKELEEALEKQAGYLVSGIQQALGPIAQSQQGLQQALSMMAQQATGSQQMPLQPRHGEGPAPVSISSDAEMTPEHMMNPNLQGWEAM